LPNFSLPFTIETGASGFGIGVVLMQQGKPITFYSQSLGPKAFAQSVYHKEALPILQALKKWTHYVLGSKLIIKNDQQSLKHMMTQRLAEGIQHKLLMKLLEFDYTIDYKKGQENMVADALSRQDHTIYAISSVIPSWMSDIEASYKDDPLYTDILQQVTLSDQALPQYTIHQGIIRYKGRICVGSSTNLKHHILSSLHSSSIGGHSGIRATYHKVSRIFHWPKLKKTVEDFVTAYAICQRAKAEHCQYPGLLAPLPIPGMAWTMITMDFIEGLPKSGGKNVILVVVDRLTKYAYFLALSHPYTAQTVAQLFIDYIIKLHGPPVAIVSDRDRIFTSKLWQYIFKAFKVSLHFSSSYRPQTDGQSERVNQCLESYLRCMTFLEPKKWHSWLSLAEWWYNTNYHSSLKCTPFEALYGYKPPLISEIMVLGPESPAMDFLAQKQHMITKLKDNLSQAQERIKKYADQRRTKRQFQIGDMVYLKLQPFRYNAFGLHQGLKLTTKFYGPFKVLEKIGQTGYKLQLLDTTKIHLVFHVSQPHSNLPLVTFDGYIKLEPIAVLDIRAIPRADNIITQWKVQWQNLSEAQSTWEDKLFIKSIFPEFYHKTLKSW
jgi:transposase InsO family protein